MRNQNVDFNSSEESTITVFYFTSTSYNLLTKKNIFNTQLLQ